MFYFTSTCWLARSHFNKRGNVALNDHRSLKWNSCKCRWLPSRIAASHFHFLLTDLQWCVYSWLEKWHRFSPLEAAWMYICLVETMDHFPKKFTYMLEAHCYRNKHSSRLKRAPQLSGWTVFVSSFFFLF